jgi:hypothetical protein
MTKRNILYISTDVVYNANTLCIKCLVTTFRNSTIFLIFEWLQGSTFGFPPQNKFRSHIRAHRTANNSIKLWHTYNGLHLMLVFAVLQSFMCVVNFAFLASFPDSVKFCFVLIYSQTSIDSHRHSY